MDCLLVVATWSLKIEKGNNGRVCSDKVILYSMIWVIEEGH